MNRRNFLRSSAAVALSTATPALVNAAPSASEDAPAYTTPLGIAMEEYPYPYPVSFLTIPIEGHIQRMAYMDVPPAGTPSGKTVLMLHGKNFWSAYWKETIEVLNRAGHRVITPDQIGFGKSAKPDDIAYSFDLLAANTAHLLDTLGVGPVIVHGHSMGGMVAIEFVVNYPERTAGLILENPIGLEDYRLQGVPPRSTEQLIEDELGQTVEKIRAYRKTYFTKWLPAYERFVEVPARILLSGEFPRYARSAALTTQMIYQQPVVHNLSRIHTPTLLIIGQSDRTAIGRDRISDPALRERLGQYPQLGRATHDAISGSKLVEIPDCGHIPHIERPEPYRAAVLDFLKS